MYEVGCDKFFLVLSTDTKKHLHYYAIGLMSVILDLDCVNICSDISLIFDQYNNGIK